MRQDMAKVIVTRPRTGGGLTRKGRDKPFEDQPKMEGLKKRHQKGWNQKQLNEYLSPLYRYLEAQVGRPWNDVYSEIRAQIKPGNTVQEHVLLHVNEKVLTTVVKNDNFDPCYCYQRWGNTYQIENGRLFVHPDTGILTRMKVDVKKKHQESLPWFIDGDNFIFQDKGIWYKADIVTYQIVKDIIPYTVGTGTYERTSYLYPNGEKSWRLIDVARQAIQDARKGYVWWNCPYSNGKVLAKHSNKTTLNKRQLSSKELKKFNLVNK